MCSSDLGWAGRDRHVWGNSTLRALDYRTGRVVWNHELGDGGTIAGILTTAGRLMFTADNSGNLLALDPATGKTLWHLNAGGPLVASPMTYQLDGRQYVIIPVQDVMYAFALPENLPSERGQRASLDANPARSTPTRSETSPSRRSAEPPSSPR